MVYYEPRSFMDIYSPKRFFEQNEAKLEFQKIKKEATKNISSFNWREFEDRELKRLIKFYYSQGNNMKTEELTKVKQF